MQAMGAARTMVGAAESGGGGGVGTNDQAALRREEQTRAAENRRDPLGWDTNLTWLQTRSGMLDKRPALEYLVGIDRYTGAYIPELAEKWIMSPDGKDWTVTLRQGIPFHDNWGSSAPETCVMRFFSSRSPRQPRAIPASGGR